MQTIITTNTPKWILEEMLTKEIKKVVMIGFGTIIYLFRAGLK